MTSSGHMEAASELTLSGRCSARSSRVSLAPGTGEIESAINLGNERHPAGRRSIMSVLANVAQLSALLAAMSDAERRECLMRSETERRTRLDRLLTGQFDRVAVEICDRGSI
jgi:hypothetical protein